MVNSENLSAADVAAVVGANGRGMNGFGGDGSFWIIVLFLFALMGGYGNGFGGNNGFAPWMFGNMNTNNDVQRGFDQASVMSGINALTASTANGFANAEVSRCNAQTNVLQALNNNQMGLYQTLNANQSALIQGINNMQSSFQDCCCENRLATANQNADIAREAAAGRAQTQATGQMIMDKLCQLELDGIKQNYENRIAGMQNQIDTLRTQINDAGRVASQTAQTAQILADNAAQTMALESYLNPTPRPAWIVQPPYSANNYGYSCGCNM